jgi:phosphatidylserine/phosphatidylglycerophosphate/cardiolipin synthase-like enzyme
MLIVLLSSSAYAEKPITCFSPRGGCEALIVRKIEAAKKSIFLLAYNFSSKPIAKALIAAHVRGVRVELVLDRSNLTAKGSELGNCRLAGIPVYVDGAHRIMHDKVLIFDGVEVETGSFNYSRSAELSNGENVVILQDAELAQKFQENWNLHKEHSK